MLLMYNPFTRSEGKAFSQGTEATWWKNEGLNGFLKCFGSYSFYIKYLLIASKLEA